MPKNTHNNTSNIHKNQQPHKRMNFIPNQANIPINQNESKQNSIPKSQQPIAVPPDSMKQTKDTDNVNNKQSIPNSNRPVNNINKNPNNQNNKSISSQHTFQDTISNWWNSLVTANKQHQVHTIIIECVIGLIIICLLIFGSFELTTKYPSSSVSMPNKSELYTAKNDSLSLQRDLDNYHVSQPQQIKMMNHFLRLDTKRQIFVYNRIKVWRFFVVGSRSKTHITNSIIFKNNR